MSCASQSAQRSQCMRYVSCIVDCPYEGAIDPKQVAKVTKRLLDMGCYEFSLGETIGTATPDRVQKVWDACLGEVDAKVLSRSFPQCLRHGDYQYKSVLLCNRHSVFDSSIAGLGWLSVCQRCIRQCVYRRLVLYYPKWVLKEVCS